MQRKLKYRNFVYASYAFFILLSALWFIIELYMSHAANYTVLFLFAIFCVQAYYNHRIANLAVGLVLLPISIFGLLHFIAWGGKAGFDTFISTMIVLGVISIAASVILVFSYLKMSFDNDKYPL